MGVFKLSSGSSSPPMPNPHRFVILDRVDYFNATVLMVKYFGCTTFEGRKILVTVPMPDEIPVLDPHFYEEGPVLARFKPDKAGWRAAIEYARSLK